MSTLEASVGICGFEPLSCAASDVTGVDRPMFVPLQRPRTEVSLATHVEDSPFGLSTPPLWGNRPTNLISLGSAIRKHRVRSSAAKLPKPSGRSRTAAETPCRSCSCPPPPCPMSFSTRGGFCGACRVRFGDRTVRAGDLLLLVTNAELQQHLPRHPTAREGDRFWQRRVAR